MKNNTIILLTSNFPFGKGETFLENEISYLASKFEILIIVSNNLKDKQTRFLPENVIVERFDYMVNSTDKLLAIKNIFHIKLKEEKKFVKKKLKTQWSFFKLKTALISLYKSEKINKYLMSLNKKYLIDESESIYYSYWMNDNAIALSMSGFKTKVCRVHGWDLYFERNKENYLPFRKAIAENLKIYTISSQGKIYLKEKIAAENLEISRLGTKNWGKNNFSTNEPPIIVSCSNVIALKRLNLIIDSLSFLSKTKYQWIHFGDGPLLTEIKNYAKEKNVNCNFKGYVDNKGVLSFFKKESIAFFINLSTTEGIPVSIMEAYSFGIPAIATNVGGTSELVNNSNGILLDKNTTAEQVSREIDTFLSLDIQSLNLKRIDAYNTWKTKFNAEKNYTEFAETISNL